MTSSHNVRANAGQTRLAAPLNHYFTDQGTKEYQNYIPVRINAVFYFATLLLVSPFYFRLRVTHIYNFGYMFYNLQHTRVSYLDSLTDC